MNVLANTKWIDSFVQKNLAGVNKDPIGNVSAQSTAKGKGRQGPAKPATT